MATVEGELLSWWRDQGVKDHYNSLKISMWTHVEDPHNSFPKLKGRAMEIKSLAPALANVWQKHMAATIEHQANLAHKNFPKISKR